jgi:hypothetical protein
MAITLAVLVLAGCSAPAATPATAPASTSPSTAAPSPPAAPDPGLRACLGPWSGSGRVRTYVLVAYDDPDSVPPVEATEAGLHVGVWLNATPPREGRGSFAPKDDVGAALPDGTVHFNLTGDPAYGEADLPPGTYEFGFNPYTGPAPDDISWSVEIREVPRPDAPQCR